MFPLHHQGTLSGLAFCPSTGSEDAFRDTKQHETLIKLFLEANQGKICLSVVLCVNRKKSFFIFLPQILCFHGTFSDLRMAKGKLFPANQWKRKKK
jgi:hypothetical protein